MVVAGVEEVDAIVAIGDVVVVDEIEATEGVNFKAI